MSTPLWELARGELPDPDRLVEASDQPQNVPEGTAVPQDPLWALAIGLPVDPRELVTTTTVEELIRPQERRPGPTRAGLRERQYEAERERFLTQGDREFLAKVIEQMGPTGGVIEDTRGQYMGSEVRPRAWEGTVAGDIARKIGGLVMSYAGRHGGWSAEEAEDAWVALNDFVAQSISPAELERSGIQLGAGIIGRLGRFADEGAELPEQILRATVQSSDGQVFQGLNHADALAKAKRAGVPDELLPDYHDAADPRWGFRTDLRDHISREEAADVMRAGGAVENRVNPLAPDAPGLRAENLEPGQLMRPTTPTARVAYTSPELTPAAQRARARFQQLTRRYAASMDNSAPDDFGSVPLLGRGEYDEETAQQIARIYERAVSTPDDPAVREAYEQFAREIDEQYDFVTRELGIEMVPTTDDPYPNSTEMMRDIYENGRLKVYASETDHPILSHDQQVRFRFIHDVMGHGLFGNSFGKVGEENAARMHADLFSELARKAMLTETRGQNSWVNWGPFGEANRADPANTVFATQKAFILPDRYTQPVVQPITPLRPVPQGGSRVDDLLRNPGAIDNVAIRYNGRVWSADDPKAIHSDVIDDAAKELGMDPDDLADSLELEVGYTLNNGDFVDRVQGLEAARAAGQIDEAARARDAELGLEGLPSEHLTGEGGTPNLTGTVADPTVTDIDREIAHLYNITGQRGLTYDPFTGRDLAGDDVWTVGRDITLEGRGPLTVTPEDVRDFRVARADQLSADPERANIGLWNNGRETVYDVSDAYVSRDAAIRHGVLGDQQSIGNPNRYYRGSDAAEYVITPVDRIAVRRAQARLNTEAGFNRTRDEYFRGATDEEIEWFNQANRGDQMETLGKYLASPTPRAMATMAAVGRNMIGWYRTSGQALWNWFGKDAPRFTALLAGVSPRVSVPQSLDYALDIWDSWVRAGRPQDWDEIQKLIPEPVMRTVHPGIRQAFEATDDDLMDPAFLEKAYPPSAGAPGRVLRGGKTNNFAANLFGNMQRLTFDAHMAEGAGGLNSATIARVLGYSSAVRQGAQIVEDITGRAITTREAQEMIWGPLQAIRARGASGVDLLMDPQYVANLSEELVNTPTFATMLRDPNRVQKLRRLRRWAAGHNYTGFSVYPEGDGWRLMLNDMDAGTEHLVDQVFHHKENAEFVGARALQQDGANVGAHGENITRDPIAAKYGSGVGQESVLGNNPAIGLQGWERPVFHGTRAGRGLEPDFDEMYPFTHAGTAESATDRLTGTPALDEAGMALYGNDRLGAPGTRVRMLHIPGESDMARWIDVADLGTQWQPKRMLDELAIRGTNTRGEPLITPRDRAQLQDGLERVANAYRQANPHKIRNPLDGPSPWLIDLTLEGREEVERLQGEYLARELRDRGIMGFRYQNVVEHPGSTSYLIPDPNSPPIRQGIGRRLGQDMEAVIRDVDLLDWGQRSDIGKRASRGEGEYLFGVGGGIVGLGVLNELNRRREETDRRLGPPDYWTRRLQARELAEQMAPNAARRLTPIRERAPGSR